MKNLLLVLTLLWCSTTAALASPPSTHGPYISDQSVTRNYSVKNKASNSNSKNECRNNIDDDGDGFIDKDDSGCLSKGSKDETNCGDNVCEGLETVQSCRSDCYMAPVISPVSYLYDYQTVEGIPDLTRVRGVGFTPDPSIVNPPIVFITTLNTARCVADDPATEPYTVTINDYDCPEGYSEVALAEGMLYLAERLAKNGFIAIAIDSNQFMWQYYAAYTSDQITAYREALILEHMRLWEYRADMTRVSVVGHSYGGLIAYNLSQHYPLESIYLIAPAINQDWQVDIKFGMLLSGCDEDAGTHWMNGRLVFDNSIEDRTFEMEQVYIKKGNHAHYNANALSGWSGCIDGYENLIPAEEQRAIAADAISGFITGEYTEPQASVSYFDSTPDPIELQYSGFTSVLACGPYCEGWTMENPNPVYYYNHNVVSAKLTWDGPATIMPPSGVTNWSFRVTYPSWGGRNPDGVVINGVRLPEPINDNEYDDSCKWDDLLWDGKGGWMCGSWWQLPREILHTFNVTGPITFDGSGQIIIGNAESN